MFIEINKINSRNEDGKAFIQTESIVGMCSQPNHVTKLYDEDGNVVSETQDENRYAVLTNVGQTYIVSKQEYERLKTELTK